MYRPHEVPSPAIMMFPFSIITEWPFVHSPPVTCGKDLCGWWVEEFILLMRRECEMKVRYAMFYNYHKLLNDQTTTKHKFITFFRPSPSRKTFYRDFFVSLRKSKSIIDWYTPDTRHTAQTDESDKANFLAKYPHCIPGWWGWGQTCKLRVFNDFAAYMYVVHLIAPRSRSGDWTNCLHLTLVCLCTKP